MDGHNDILLASDYNTSLIAFGSAAGAFHLKDEVQASLTDENGMGGLVTDLNADGIDDWLVTSIFAPPPCPFGACGAGLSGNRAYVNTAGAPPKDEASALGIAAGGWGWGIIRDDFDHDGHDDLVSAAGMYFPEGFGMAPLDESGYATDPVLAWRGLGDGSGFDEIEVQISGGHPPSARSLQAADFDNDGDLDLFLGGSGVPVRVLENTTVTGVTGSALTWKVHTGEPLRSMTAREWCRRIVSERRRYFLERARFRHCCGCPTQTLPMRFGL